MTRDWVMGAAAMALAGCGTAPEEVAVNNTASVDDYAARMRALPAGQRDGVLLRAIRDAGRDCQQVIRSAAIPDSTDVPAWTATCDGGGMWIVALNPGGVATVTSAVDAARAPAN